MAYITPIISPEKLIQLNQFQVELYNPALDHSFISTLRSDKEEDEVKNDIENFYQGKLIVKSIKLIS